MIRKFRRIFRAPSSPPSTTARTTTTKNETMHKTSSSDSTLDDTSYIEKGSSSITNHLYSGKEKKNNSFTLFLVFDSIEIMRQGVFVFFSV